MNTLKEIRKQIVVKIVELDELRSQERTLLERKKIRCPRCKTYHTVSKTELIQEHFYIPPRGCTEGDYWNSAEIGFICNKCNNFITDYHNPKIKELKHLFNDITDEYKHGGRRGNNDFTYHPENKSITLHRSAIEY
jgi:hypothetical protein